MSKQSGRRAVQRPSVWATTVLASALSASHVLAQAPPSNRVESAQAAMSAESSRERWAERRARAHTQALQSDWTAAAESFSELARETGDPGDRLAAMRSFAQAQRFEQAIAEGERLMATVSGLPERDRRDAFAELANLHESQGYRLRRAGEARRAALAFERAYELDRDRVRLLAEAGYARLAAGDRALAADRFVDAIDRLPETVPSDRAVSADPGDELPLRERLRREVLEARRAWTLSAFQAWRPRGSGPGAGAGTVGLQRDGLIAAQGGAELALRLPEMRSEIGARQADVFARALWSQRGDSLEINDRSVQGGAGVRWQPVIGSAWRVTAERLIAIGEDARDDWLLRLAWGAMVGDQPAPGRRYWPAGQLYIEAGRFFENGGSTAMYGEGRFGLTTMLGDGWRVTPHAVVAAREVRPDPGAESWAEAGLGLAFRRAFGATPHSADRGRFEWLMQYRLGISGAGRQGWLFAASILW
ncbi:MAG: NfrA family protein [Burkholderiaceae bacterium]